MPNKLRLFCLAIFVLLTTKLEAQRFLSDYDSLMFLRDTLVETVDRYSNLHISAYLQPQFQIASAKGADSYAGGNFGSNVNNRFMLRRARLKFDYKIPSKTLRIPSAIFTFQFEATERDVNVRDMFVRLFEPSAGNFSLAAGLFARPFGFEVNLSSSFRESPERGRMSQILMPSERDLGAMVSYESQKSGRKPLQLKIDAGLFNGQGKSGPAEFDSYKDFISRVYLKPVNLFGNWKVSYGLSFLEGGWIQTTPVRFEMKAEGAFTLDSNAASIGSKAPRQYRGADIQLVRKTRRGSTQLRFEYWRGNQPGTSETTVNPGTLPDGPTYIRPFDGMFAYFLQTIGSPAWELIVKYDSYDPNRKASGVQIGTAGSNLGAADIKYETLGFGLTHYVGENVKAIAYYDLVRNEKTSLEGFETDLSDDVFTFRIQVRF